MSQLLKKKQRKNPQKKLHRKRKLKWMEIRKRIQNRKLNKRRNKAAKVKSQTRVSSKKRKKRAMPRTRAKEKRPQAKRKTMTKRYSYRKQSIAPSAMQTSCPWFVMTLSKSFSTRITGLVNYRVSRPLIWLATSATGLPTMDWPVLAFNCSALLAIDIWCLSQFKFYSLIFSFSQRML